jgi:hypothetical protein
MAFLLKNVVPWGRRLEEYQDMFHLTEEELLSKKIVSFGDGPASFNAEGTKLGARILSLDPIYQFSKQALQGRLDETRGVVMEQMRQNQEHYRWNKIKSLAELEEMRMSAMYMFLDDYEQGCSEHRYQYHELPERLPYEDDSFDLGLSSHFLLLYPSLGLDFHLQSIQEMLRVCKEIRIFPLVDLDGQKSELTQQVIEHFQEQYTVQIQTVDYEFQKGANAMLVIRKSAEA